MENGLDWIGEVLFFFYCVLDSHVLNMMFVKSYVVVICDVERHYIPTGGAWGH